MGDQAGEAVIVESTGKTFRGRRLATVGMATYCLTCKQRGLVAPRGVRSTGADQLLALSGDVNLCGCHPPPVFDSSCGMKVVFTAEDIVRWEAMRFEAGIAPASKRNPAEGVSTVYVAQGEACIPEDG
jgi:hypothetical protein